MYKQCVRAHEWRRTDAVDIRVEGRKGAPAPRLLVGGSMYSEYVRILSIHMHVLYSIARYIGLHDNKRYVREVP